MVAREGTLVLVCRRDFCRLLDHVLRAEGLADFQHGDLTLLGSPGIQAQLGSGATEVFVIPADLSQAERLKNILRACPVRSETDDLFALYTVGD